jgi:TolA-binding protein
MLNHRKNNKILNNIMLSVVLVLTASSINAQQLNTAVQVAVDTNNASAKAQNRIDKLNDQTDNLTGQYRTILNEIESLRAYNKQLESVVGDQRQQITSINDQMTHLEQTNRGVVPMIIEMVDALGKLVESDLPFKTEERRNRVVKLENILGKSRVTTAEIYRKVTEAYGIELDYGSTVDSYGAALPSGTKVDFLRVGRISLIYQTLNQQESGWWNPTLGKFEKLDKRYNAEIKEAIRIAKKQASPNLTGLPVLGAVAGE